MNLKSFPFSEVFTDVSGGNRKVPKSDYLEAGRIPVIDQGKDYIGGYIDDDDFIFKKDCLPVIIFGDHTRCFKYVDHPFAIGADGVKVLKSAISQHVKYLYHFLMATRIPDTGYNRHFKYLKRITIPCPPLSEQKRIAAILDKAEALREKRRQTIAKLDELLQSVFLDMFGDPVTNPKGWNTKHLEEITTKITDGVHLRPKYTESGIPFISVKDITTGRLSFEKCKFISREAHLKYTKRWKPEFGDILYTKVGATYGRPALIDVNTEFSIYVSVCLIKPERKLVRPQFLREVMATTAIKRQADRSIKGIGVPDLHLNMIRKFIVPVPDINTQDAFIRKTQLIQRNRFESEKHLSKIETLFASLYQRAFKGEL